MSPAFQNHLRYLIKSPHISQGAPSHSWGNVDSLAAVQAREGDIPRPPDLQLNWWAFNQLPISPNPSFPVEDKSLLPRRCCKIRDKIENTHPKSWPEGCSRNIGYLNLEQECITSPRDPWGPPVEFSNMLLTILHSFKNTHTGGFCSGSQTSAHGKSCGVSIINSCQVALDLPVLHWKSLILGYHSALCKPGQFGRSA